MPVFSNTYERTVFEDFLDGIEEDTEISVHAEAYLYGEGEAFKVAFQSECSFHKSYY